MKRSIIGILLSIGIALLLAFAGSDGSVRLGSLPLFAICGSLAFLVHWLIFIPSFVYRTEHYFDLTGSIAYVTVVVAALLGRQAWDARSLVIALLILVWTLRLGYFLFRRVKRAGKDDRFDRLKTDFLAFFMVWTLSGLWVFLTAAPGIAAISAGHSKALDWIAMAGISIWLIGFAVEAVADHQKTRFKAQSANRDKFISTGLWAWSRHPNYFGEIVLWTGIAVIAFPVLTGWQRITLVSPVFVWFLLTRVSGIPLLEAKAEAKWGSDPAYQRYRDTTAILIPWPPSRQAMAEIRPQDD